MGNLKMESNIYKLEKIKNRMNKRGEITTIIAVVTFIVMAGSIIVGSYFVTQEEMESDINAKGSYVGDINTKTFYELKCVKNITKENRVYFEDYSQAKSLKFDFAGEKCP